MHMTKRPSTKLPNFVEIISTETTEERILNLITSAPNNMVIATDCSTILDIPINTCYGVLVRLTRKGMLTQKRGVALVRGMRKTVTIFKLERVV